MAPSPPIVVSYPSNYREASASGPCRDLDDCISRRGGLWLSPTTLWVLLALLIVLVLGSVAVYFIRRRRRRPAQNYGMSFKARYMAVLDKKSPDTAEVAPAYYEGFNSDSMTPLTTTVPAVPSPPPSYRPS